MNDKVDTRQNKKLTNLQVFQLFNWLKDHIERDAFESGITAAQVAVFATTALPFEVNQNHVQGALEQMQLRLPKGPCSDAVKIGILKRAVEKVYFQLDLQLPPEWADL
jgi:hypothetical protein